MIDHTQTKKSMIIPLYLMSSKQISGLNRLWLRRMLSNAIENFVIFLNLNFFSNPNNKIFLIFEFKIIIIKILKDNSRLINIIFKRVSRSIDTFFASNSTPELNFDYRNLEIIILINLKINLKLYKKDKLS